MYTPPVFRVVVTSDGFYEFVGFHFSLHKCVYIYIYAYRQIFIYNIRTYVHTQRRTPTHTKTYWLVKTGYIFFLFLHLHCLLCFLSIDECWLETLKTYSYFLSFKLMHRPILLLPHLLCLIFVFIST